MVIETAEPVSKLEPVEAIHAALKLAMEAVFISETLPWIILTIFSATTLPIVADGIPVRGGAGVILVPKLFFRGMDI